MRADNLEKLTDETVRRPVHDPDAASPANDAQEFTCGALLVGREHDTEGGERNIEAVVLNRQVLCIGQLERHRRVFGRGPLLGALEQRGETSAVST